MKIKITTENPLVIHVWISLNNGNSDYCLQNTFVIGIGLERKLFPVSTLTLCQPLYFRGLLKSNCEEYVISFINVLHWMLIILGALESLFYRRGSKIQGD